MDFDAGDTQSQKQEPSTLPERAADTTPDAPWPLHVLSQKLKAHIERAPAAWIEGQIIELNLRGNMNFLTLRDLDQEMSLPLSAFGNVISRTTAPLERGSHVVAHVKAGFWLKSGRLSMQAQDIRPVGLGDLLARIERLKQALAAEGLFAAERKRPLPLLPSRVGLITGRDSDAMKDVIRNATLRWPAVQFEVREVAVQGNTAVAQVTQALQELDSREDIDVIVIARGGGSLEDLLAFSNESLVRAVAAAQTPIVSAIGHEADRPILDEVADLRASTPTDAAKRIVPDMAEEMARIQGAKEHLTRLVLHQLTRESERINTLRSRPALAYPMGMVEVRQQDVDRLRERSHHATIRLVERAQSTIDNLRGQVRALSPLQTLERGYAVVLTNDGDLVRSTAQVPDGTGLSVRVADGKFGAISTGIVEQDQSAVARQER